MNNLQPYIIKETGGYVTNIDAPDLPDTVLTECRGGVSRQDGAIFQRDHGTLHRIAVPPLRPNVHIVITGMASNGAPNLIRVTSVGHGYSTNDVVYIDEVAGTVEAIGKWTITKITDDTFDLVGSTFMNAWTSGGIATKTPITILKVHTFVDTGGTEYEIVVGLDSNSLTRIYVYDSVWIELTRKINALVNDTIGAGDATFDIDTITENGVAYTPSADEFNNWIVVNTQSGQNNETVLITDCTASNLTVDAVVGSNGLGWANNDTVEIYRFPTIKFNYTYSNGVTPLINFLPIEEQRKATVLYTDSSTPKVARQAIQIVKRDARNFMYDAISAYNRTLLAGWYVESDFGSLNPYYINEGTVGSPFTTYGYLREIYSISGTTTVTIRTTAAHNLSTGNVIMLFGLPLYDVNGIWTITVVDTDEFTLDKCVGGGTYPTPGSSSGYIIAIASSSVYNETNGRDWLSVSSGKYVVANTATIDYRKFVRVYVTLTFSGYQESDPVFQGFYNLGTSSTSADGAELYLGVSINFALMNKEITAINFYGAAAPSDTSAQDGNWADADGDYYLIYSLSLNTAATVSYFKKQNTAYNAKPYFGVATGAALVGISAINSSTIGDAGAGAATTILDALGHSVDKNRSYPTPRYAVRVARPQGAITVIDADDSTLRVSNRNGDNVNEDDNFPDTSVDNTASALKIFLNTSGELLGLGVLNDQIHAFKKTEREIKNLQSKFQGIVKCDFVARESLVLCPKGLSWGGERGIYLLPSYGGEEEIINPQWQNLYDGSLLATATLPYMTTAYRAAIVGGYSETYESLWFSAQITTAAGSTEYVSFVYSFQRKALSGKPVGWYQRELNIGSTNGLVKCFSSRRADKTLTIVTSNGILQYPNRSGSYLFQDDVLVNGAGTQYSQSKGIPTKLKINIGSLYGLASKAVYDNFRMDFDGASISGSGTFNIKFWANKKTDAAVETKTQRIDTATVYPVVRPIPPIGSLERMAIQIDLTEDAESDLKKFDISTIEFGFAKNPEIGNK